MNAMLAVGTPENLEFIGMSLQINTLAGEAFRNMGIHVVGI
jgi:hypothetical protein